MDRSVDCEGGSGARTTDPAKSGGDHLAAGRAIMSRNFQRKAETHLREFIDLHGHAHVMGTYVASDGYALGQRVSSWRRRNISAEFIAMLDSIPEWRWTAADARWAAGVALLRAHGDKLEVARPPRGWVLGGFNLESWVEAQRRAFGAGELTPEQVSELESIPGWAWSQRAHSWSESLGRLRRYAAEFGTAAVPLAYVTPCGYRLGSWAGNRRRDYQSGNISAERIAQLESVPGWSWDMSNSRPSTQWAEGIEHLRWFVEQTGCMDVPVTYRWPDGFPLGRWMRSRRRELLDGVLTDERAAELADIPGWAEFVESIHQGHRFGAISSGSDARPGPTPETGDEAGSLSQSGQVFVARGSMR